MTRREPPAKEWMSTRVACGALGVNLNRLYRMIDTGKIPAYGSAESSASAGSMWNGPASLSI